MSNFIIQRLDGNNPDNTFITIYGASSRLKSGASFMASGQTTAPADRSFDRFNIDPAIQRDAYKNTDRVIPYSIHTQFIIRY